MDEIIRADVPFQALLEKRQSYFFISTGIIDLQVNESGILLAVFSILGPY